MFLVPYIWPNDAIWPFFPAQRQFRPYWYANAAFPEMKALFAGKWPRTAAAGQLGHWFKA